jgi:hypothetical protein
MTDEPMPTDELRGSAPMMSAKDLLLEVYRDMKFVRPAVENLLAAGVVARIDVLERDAIAARSAGVNNDLVHRVSVLEDEAQNRVAAGVERRRLADFSNKTIVLVVLVSNFVVGGLIALINYFEHNP